MSVSIKHNLILKLHAIVIDGSKINGVGMTKIVFLAFENISPEDFLPVLNKQRNREHLIKHEIFDIESVKAWMNSKKEVDAIEGCRVRGVVVDEQLVGWCGLQLEKEQYEIAIVIDEQYWGIGKAIFKEVFGWAKGFNHKVVCIHLLHTRPEYQFLRKMSKRVYATELLGSQFTTYELEIG